MPEKSAPLPVLRAARATHLPPKRLSAGDDDKQNPNAEPAHRFVPIEPADEPVMWDLGLRLILRMGWRAWWAMSLRAMWKAGTLYILKGASATWAYKRRRKNDILYPPFMFLALTDSCNLRCQGCWVEKEGTAHALAPADVDTLITEGKKQKAHYYTLLGGEPFIYPGFFDIFTRHADCYFQVITNGLFHHEKNVKQLAAAGNITPLISIDGFRENNDMRRGEGVYDAIMDGLARLREHGVLFGIATTVTGKNMDEVMSDAYVEEMTRRGAMYLWYYIYRPVGAEPHPEYCVERAQLIELRKRLLRLRKKHPLFIIDTYWTAEGEAFCPAAMGLGFHIGPQGSIEICPPLSFATDQVSDNNGDLAKTLNESAYLRGFENFVLERTKGCVILEQPQELAAYIREHGAADYSGRDALAEIAAGIPRSSHHLPGDEQREDFWFYRFLKRQVFFGMAAMG